METALGNSLVTRLGNIETFAKPTKWAPFSLSVDSNDILYCSDLIMIASFIYPQGLATTRLDESAFFIELDSFAIRNE